MSNDYSRISWKTLISLEMERYGETWDDVVSNTMTEEEMLFSYVCYHGYGLLNGDPFALWTKKRVYFPVAYDGIEWVTSVSRDPDGKPIRHVGNEEI